MERLFAGFLEQFRVPLKLAADEVLQASRDVAADMLRPDRTSSHHAVELDDLLTRYVLSVATEHWDLLKDRTTEPTYPRTSMYGRF